MYAIRNITIFLFFSFFFFFSLESLAQNIDLRSLKKKLAQTNKSLTTEFTGIRLIPGKTFIIQEYEGYDSLSFYLPRRIFIDSFYISAFEVTNEQYRQFAEYIQDSILRKLMNYVKQGEDGNEYIDYTKKIDTKSTKIMESFRRIDICFVTPPQPITSIFYELNGSARLNPDKLVYNYKESGKHCQVPVMPYIPILNQKQYPYSFKDSLFINRIYDPAFKDHPVSGISFYQAQAYCHWKTEQLKNALGNNTDFDVIITLPSLYEWEAAAAGADCNLVEIEGAGDYIIRKTEGPESLATKRVNSYIAEWTTTNGDESFEGLREYFLGRAGSWEAFTDTIKLANPGSIGLPQTIDSFYLQMKNTKVVKAGTQTSNQFYLQPGVNRFYDPRAQHAAIGFRYVVLFKRK